MMRPFLIALGLIALAGSLWAEDAADRARQTFLLVGQVVSASDAAPVAGTHLSVGRAEAISDAHGNFALSVEPGASIIRVSTPGFLKLTKEISISSDTAITIELQPAPVETVQVRADLPATAASAQVYDSSELLPANPGRPGTPLEIPGYPSETASGGVKAPQYFAPGVAGDHGEPIAQYIRIGDFLFPNNLPANAHGNGYADPNLLIPAAINNVEADAGAFDVRHGNNAVNLAVAYGLQPRIEPVLEIYGDGRDYDIVSGISASNPLVGAWLGFEVAGGNGFLRLPEQRHQYKVNGERSYAFGKHQLTLFGAVYYGSSRIPGLAPIGVSLPQDTIDPRQSDRTHTALFVASDTWQISEGKTLEFSGYVRDYRLNLRSDFGDGLIRQSESRYVIGGNTSFQQEFNSHVSFMAGLDLRQDAPHNAELAHLVTNGLFQPVTRNNFTIGDLAPYVAFNGSLSRLFSYSVGVRRDQITFHNTDLLTSANSYRTSAGQTSPRATLYFHASEEFHMPAVALSFGEGFHTNDPRIGLGTARGTPIASSRAYQLVATESIAGTQFRLTLVRVSNSQELAKIDPDTGLQQNLGPSLIRSLSLSAHRHFSFGSFQATFARAQATDRLTGYDVPEAPRLIWDVSAASIRLPKQLRGSAGLEYVGRKPLGDGFTALPVREFHGSLTRSFANGLLDASLQFSLANGYTGQTLETLQLPGELYAFERIVGVRKPSYAGIAVTYHLRRGGR
jgi:hypothetical protein